MIKEIGVAVSRGKSGQFRIYFDKKDVQRACRMMVCGDGCDSCMRLMEQSAITCELCYSVLIAMKKRPATIREIFN